MAESKGYNLGVGFIHATVSFDGIGQQIAKEMRKVTPKAGQDAGKRIGKGMREGVEKEAAKVDLSAYEAQVKSTEERITKHVAAAAEKQEAAKRKVQIAEAKLAEAREKYKDDSSQVLAAEDRLAQARGNLAREADTAQRAQAKLNDELSDAKKSLGDAKRAAEETADAYKRSFGRRFVRGIHESLREAVSSQTAVVAAGATGALAGFTWGQAFKRALGGQNVGAFAGSMIAGMSGARTLSDIGGGFRDFVTNLDRIVPKLGGVGIALGAIGGAGIAAVGGLLGVVQGLGSIAAVGLTLPGLIGAGAASMAIFGMAIADVATVLADLGPGFAELQDNVSAAFWERAAQPIRDLANNVMPILQQRMSEVAWEMGGIATAIANTLNSQVALGQLEGMFVYLRDAIDTAGDGVGAMTEAIMTLGLVGASYLPDLASWFNRISWSFQAWVQDSAANGDIFRWIDNGIINLKALGSVLASTVGIFHALGTAAQDAGAGGLVGMAEAMERANRALHTDEWQAGLTSMFSGARESMAYVGEGFGDLFRGLHSAGGVLREAMILSGSSVGLLLTSLGRLFESPAVQGGLYDFFNGVHEAVLALTDSSAPLGTILGGLMSTMGTIASTLGGVVAGAVEAVGPALSALIEAVRPLIPALGNIVSAVIDGLAPVLTTVAGIVANVLLPPLVGFAQWLGDNGPMVEGIVLVLGTMAAILGTAALAVAAFHGALAVLRTVMIGVNIVMAMNPFVLIAAALAGLVVGVIYAYNNIGWFKDAVDAAWAGIKAAFSATIDWITNVAWPALLNGLQWVGDKFVWLYNNVVLPVWNWIKGTISGVVSWFQNDAGNGLVATIDWVAQKFTWLNTNIVQPVWNWIKGAVSAVVAWFATTAVPAFNAAVDLLASKFNWFQRNIIGPVVFFTRLAINTVVTWFQGVAVPLFRAAVQFLADKFTWFRDAVITPVFNWVRSVINSVASWFSNVLVPLFRRAVQFLADKFTWFRDNVVTPVWNWVRTKIQEITNWFANTLVPWFRRSIQSISDKFTDFRNWVVSIWDRVRGKIQEIVTWFTNDLVARFRAGIQRISDKFTEFRNWVGGVWDRVKTLLRDGWNWIDSNVFAKFRSGLDTLKDAFTRTKDGIGDAWDKLKAKVREPIAFVVNSIVNPFLEGYNKINNAWSGDDIGLIPGFRKGGYTGNHGKDDVAGVVHGQEHVIRAESRRSIENTNPGLLDAMNRYGASALNMGCAHDHGATAYGKYDNPAFMAPGVMTHGQPSFTFPLQKDIYRTGVLNIAGSAPGWDLPGAIRMMDDATSISVRRGPETSNSSYVALRNFPFTWSGFYSPEDNGIMLNSGNTGHLSVSQKRTIAAHEIGHALGLPHAMSWQGGNGAFSVMNYDNMFQAGGPTSADVAALAAIYGGAGKAGTASSPVPGNGGGDNRDDEWGGILGKLKDLVKNPLGDLTSKFKDNVFADMGAGLAEKVVEGLIAKGKSLFFGGGDSTSAKVNGVWDDPVGTVQKLRPGLSTIYNGTGSSEFFQRVDPSDQGGSVVELGPQSMAMLQHVADRVDIKVAERSLVTANRTAEAKFARR